MVLKGSGRVPKTSRSFFYLLTTDVGTALLKDLKAEQRQLEHGAGRFAADVRWHTRQRRRRSF